MSKVEEIELSLEKAKELVERKRMAEKLASNREFKKLVLDGYFKDEAVRLVGLLGDPGAAPYREQIQLEMAGISMFQQFMRNVIRMGQIAESEMPEHEQLLDEVRDMGDAELEDH